MAGNENDSDSDFVKHWVHELSFGGSSTLRLFIESLQADIKSRDRLKQENGLKRIILVISKLPDDFPWLSTQEELLINFLMANYSVLDKPDVYFLAAVKKLVSFFHIQLMKSPHLAVDYIQVVVEKLFHQEQVQTFSQKERYVFYQILDILLTKYHKELLENPYFISYFISAINGEQDPRCLVIIFRLFCIICKHSNLGNFPKNLFNIYVNDLFDVIACYYPIQFQQNSKERTEITRQLLVSGCENCLFADEEFASLVFELVIEKLTEDENSLETKLEVCTFLGKACSAFPDADLTDYIDDLCTGIRSVLLKSSSTTNITSVREPIHFAISSVIKALERSSPVVCNFAKLIYRYIFVAYSFYIFKTKNFLQTRKEQIEYVCQTFIENCELFVLKMELGLTEKNLEFFETLLKSSEYCWDIIFGAVFSWLLLLCKGDTISSVTNKSEITSESLRFLCHWIDLAEGFKQVKLMQKYYAPLNEMLNNNDYENAQIVQFKLLKVCVNLHVETEMLLEKCKIFLLKSFDSVMNCNQELKNECLMFVYAFAANNWIIAKTLLAKKINAMKELFYPVFWSAIHSPESLNFVVSHLAMLFPAPLDWGDDMQELYVKIFERNKSGDGSLQEMLLEETLVCVFAKLESELKAGRSLKTQARLLQRIGLIISDSTHIKGLHLIEQKIKECPYLLPGLYLYIIQSMNTDKILKILEHSFATEKNFTWYKSLLLAAVVNKSASYAETLKQINRFGENLEFLDNFKCRTRLTAGLMLAGRPEGPIFFAELLQDLVQYFDSSNINLLTEALVDMLTFDKCYSDPIKCKYNATFLWQQRIFCQLVAVYVQYLESLNKELWDRRVVLFAVLSPLSDLAGSLTSVCSSYAKLLSVVYDALDTNSLDLFLEKQIISALANFLKNATSEQLTDELLLKILPRLLKILSRLQFMSDSSQDTRLHLVLMECLQLVTLRWRPEMLLPYYNSVIRNLIAHSASRKRVVRQAVANVRNSW
ncbi:unnamed protein product [Thelazia callipaeda]|uniref:MMS19 nucleotide excision repair protein n=1 Tax=Thelazia callipaeda TaxID=103827 RepID=A0A0N5CQL0_THECL|nr:unnamed protein product [Thelazia callipaeda]